MTRQLRPRPITDDELKVLETAVSEQRRDGLTPFITSETAMKLLLRLQEKMPLVRYLK